MKTWLKQIFCEHIWKDMRADHLYDRVWLIGDVEIRTYHYYAVTQCCVKCSKSQIIQMKVV